jgi:hypothetical protein
MYVGTWLIFAVIMAPVYGTLLGWFLGKPRDLRKAFLGVGLLLGIGLALWIGMLLISLLFGFVFFRA